MAQNPTFGCGTFLPGEGPGNFPSFTGGGTIDSGGGNDPPDPPDGFDPQDPIDPIVVDDEGGDPPAPGPPPIGVPPTGPGPGAPSDAGPATPTSPGPGAPTLPPFFGPTSPGPGPPGIPGPPGSIPTICKCTVTAESTTDVPLSQGGVGQFAEAELMVVTTLTQQCNPTTVGAGAAAVTEQNKAAIERGKAALPTTAGEWIYLGFTIQGTAGGSCESALGCDSTLCGDVIIRNYFKRRRVFADPAEGGGEAGGVVPFGGDDPPGDPSTTPIDDQEEGGGLVLFGGEDPPDPPDTTPIDDQEEGGGVIAFGGDDPPDPPDTNPIDDQEEGGGFTAFGGDDPGGGFDATALGGGFEAAGGELVEGGTTAGATGRGSSTDRSNSNFGVNVPTNEAGDKAPSRSGLDANTIINNAISSGEIDLNDPSIISAILRKKPNGIQDSSIAFSRLPKAPTLVKNDTGFTELFNERIDSNIHYILKNRNNNANWDSTKAGGVTPDTVFASLKPEIRDILAKIRNYDGTTLNINQIFSMIGSRILDGTVGNINKRFLESLALDSQKRVPVTIKQSSINTVNEVAALSLIDKNKIPLAASGLSSREAEVLKNWKVLSSDIDKFLPVTIDGISRRYYINDDDTFIGRSTLSIQDGDYFDITSGGQTTRLFAESEIDHAFLIPETTRQKAITLLGGTPGRILSVSADAATASGIEYDSSLSSPRQPFYVLSGVLSSLDTKPSLAGSFLLKDSTMRYELTDTSSREGLATVNEYIKYKANKRIFIIDHEDLILDYIEGTSSIELTQTDIIFDSPKTNKTLPLLVRQIPFYIMIYPTNRPDYNIFNTKSKVLEISQGGAISRRLSCTTNINPEFTKSQTNKFVRSRTSGKNATDILGTSDTQARTSFIDPTDDVFKTAYRDQGKYKSASEYNKSRNKSGFRLIREIVNELDTNYELSINGVGKTLTEFDVFSRLNLRQFNILSRLENFSEISRAVTNGLVNEVKLIPPISRSDNRIVINKTQLVQRKKAAGADTFKQIKATNDGQNIVSPDTDGKGGFTPAG